MNYKRAPVTDAIDGTARIAVAYSKTMGSVWHAQFKPVVPMVRALMLMNLHGWNHESVIVQYRDEQPDLVDSLGFEKRPDQATFWRACHERFSDDLLDAIAECVRNIRILAGENRVSVPPRKTDRTGESDVPRPWEQVDDDEPTQREIIHRADQLTEQAQRYIFPAFTFDRAKQALLPPHELPRANTQNDDSRRH